MACGARLSVVRLCVEWSVAPQDPSTIVGREELLAEVLSSVRFPVEAAELQRRIESLIERECRTQREPGPGASLWLGGC